MANTSVHGKNKITFMMMMMMMMIAKHVFHDDASKTCMHAMMMLDKQGDGCLQGFEKNTQCLGPTNIGIYKYTM
jgi:hypothetical protein